MEDAAFAPEPFSTMYQRSLYHGYRAYLVQVMSALRNAMSSLPTEAKAEA